MRDRGKITNLASELKKLVDNAIGPKTIDDEGLGAQAYDDHASWIHGIAQAMAERVEGEREDLESQIEKLESHDAGKRKRPRTQRM